MELKLKLYSRNTCESWIVKYYSALVYLFNCERKCAKRFNLNIKCTKVSVIFVQ